jgi:hypothetical protein
MCKTSNSLYTLSRSSRDRSSTTSAFHTPGGPHLIAVASPMMVDVRGCTSQDGYGYGMVCLWYGTA